jgi:N-acetylneuraminic acid mutarotase
MKPMKQAMSATILMVLVLLTTSRVSNASLGWSSVSPLSTPRQSLGAARGGDGKIYAVGGDSTTGNTVEAYDPANDTWNPIAPFSVARSSFAVTAGLDGRIYVVGGWEPSNRSKVLEAYDPTIQQWVRLADMPTARTSLAATAGTDGKIYVLGGIADHGDTGLVEVYDPVSDTWSADPTLYPPMNLTHSYFAAATSLDGRIFAMSGINNGDPTTASGAAVEVFNPVTHQWTYASSMISGRYEFAATLGLDGLIYAIGGNGLPSSGPLVEVYDPANDLWSPLIPNLSTNVSDLGAATGTDGRVYAVGGNPPNIFSGSTTVSTFGASANWQTAASILADTERGEVLRTFLAVATASDGKTYSMGGNDGSQAVSDMQAFDPTSRAWIARHNMNTLREDLAATAGPDGFVYAIGGMNGNFASLSSVEAYDPIGDVWSDKTPMNTARTRLAAVTGRDGRIYVIGGSTKDNQNSTVLLSSAEAYDTTTAQWMNISPMGTARHTHAAALGPDGLIYVFGGVDATGAKLTSVEAYDPQQDSWTRKTDMPRARYSLTAITGADGLIYIFGGAPAGSERIVDIYNPATDSWMQSEAMIAGRFGSAGALGSDNRIYAVGGALGNPMNVEARQTVPAQPLVPNSGAASVRLSSTGNTNVVRSKKLPR